MIAFNEYDTVQITRSVESDFVGGSDDNVIISAGRIGDIVAILGDPERPSFYQIEFCLGHDRFAVVTIEAEFVRPVSLE